MRRRDFLRLLGVGATAAALGPVLSAVVVEDPPYQPLPELLGDQGPEYPPALMALLDAQRVRNTNNACKRLFEYVDMLEKAKVFNATLVAIA